MKTNAVRVARANLQEACTPREIAFCAHTIMGSEPLVVANASIDPRFARNPLVDSPMSVRFYAGVPLEWKPGVHVGTLCVVSDQPREASEAQIAHLQLLAGLVLDHLRLLVSLRDLRPTLGAAFSSRARPSCRVTTGHRVSQTPRSPRRLRCGSGTRCARAGTWRRSW